MVTACVYDSRTAIETRPALQLRPDIDDWSIPLPSAVQLEERLVPRSAAGLSVSARLCGARAESRGEGRRGVPPRASLLAASRSRASRRAHTYHRAREAFDSISHFRRYSYSVAMAFNYNNLYKFASSGTLVHRYRTVL